MFWVRSVLLISLVFFVLSCHLSLCSELRVAHFFSFCVLSCYVSVCSEFRVAHFFSFFCVVLLCICMFWVPCCSFHNFFVLSCYVSVCSEFRVAHFFRFCVLFCYVSLCSVFRVAHFFCFFRVVLLCVFMFWVPCCSFL